MIPEQHVKLRWNGKIKKFYIDKGYIYTNYNDYFWVRVEDVNHNSGARLTFECDYCGKQIHDKRIADFYKNRDKSILKKDSCSSCLKLRKAEESLVKHGVSHPMQLQTNVEKVKSSLMKNHGVENLNELPDFRDRVKQTSLKKFGVEHPTQSDIVIDKRRETNLIKYGYINSSLHPDIQKKVALTMYSTGKTKTSKQQIAVFNLLNKVYESHLNYPVTKFNLDIGLFIDGIKIDVEYDGWYWHQDAEKDIKRNEFMISQGWKVLRIKSGSKLPSEEELFDSINKLLLENKDYEEIVLEDWVEPKIQSSEKIS